MQYYNLVDLDPKVNGKSSKKREYKIIKNIYKFLVNKRIQKLYKIWVKQAIADITD